MKLFTVISVSVLIICLTYKTDSFKSSQKALLIEQSYYQALSGESFKCPFVNVTCNVNDRFASFDGTCNNLVNTLYGSKETPYKRILPALYDHNSDKRTLSHVDNAALPNPREVSNRANGDNNELTEPNWTHIWTTFGQFLTHDMAETSSSAADPNLKPACPCGTTNPSCFPIPVVGRRDDFGSSCMEFVRSSASFMSIGCTEFNQREQLNLINGFIDASNVYGNSKEASDSLRLFTGGQLKTSAGVEPSSPYLPLKEAACSIDTNLKCFKAGDERETENLGLAGIHTVFVREHNRIAAELAAVRPGWNDQQLFQETRKIIAAVLQHIVYDQYIPATIGLAKRAEWGLDPTTDNTYFTGYNPNLNPGIYAEFATAAMRFGHSIAHNKYSRHSADNVEIENSTLTFHDINFRVNEAYNQDKGGLDSITRGLINQQSGKYDLGIASDLQSRLIDAPAGVGFDLASYNINRGRDHGLQPYVNYVKAFTDVTVTSFDDLLKIGVTDTSIRRLKRAYSNVEDIDLWIGGIAENNNTSGHRDKILGDTFTHIFAQQFSDLKRGDRHYYENAPDATLGTASTAFTLEQLAEIKKMSLSTLLCNTLDLNAVQPDVFFVDKNGRQFIRPRNEKVSCETYQQMDFSKWA